MALETCNTALCTCSFALGAGALTVTPEKQVCVSSCPGGTIMDNVMGKNIATFGMCTSPANPLVIAAMGSPVPCTPILPGPWMPGALQVMIGGTPALDSSSTVMCQWAGVITIASPGQVPTMI